MEHFLTEVSIAVVQYIIAPVVLIWVKKSRKRKRTRRTH